MHYVHFPGPLYLQGAPAHCNLPLCCRDGFNGTVSVILLKWKKNICDQLVMLYSLPGHIFRKCNFHAYLVGTYLLKLLKYSNAYDFSPYDRRMQSTGGTISAAYHHIQCWPSSTSYTNMNQTWSSTLVSRQPIAFRFLY